MMTIKWPHDKMSPDNEASRNNISKVKENPLNCKKCS